MDNFLQAIVCQQLFRFTIGNTELKAAILNLVAFGKYDRVNNSGQLFALFAIVLAAATTAVALAIILNVYRQYKTIDPGEINKLGD